MTIQLIGNKRLKLKIITAHGEISFLEFLKGRFWDHCYLAFTSMIFFMFIGNIDIDSYADDTTPYVSGVN